MIDYARAISIADSRERECRIQARAYTIVLSRLAPANWLLVAGAALLSTAAGATIVTTTAPHYVPASLALLSAAFTVTHKGLNCDVYQDECKRLRSAYDALACRYRSLQLEDVPANLQSKLRELDASQADLRSKAQVIPPDWVLRRVGQHDLGAIAILEPRPGSRWGRRLGSCRWSRGWRRRVGVNGATDGGDTPPLAEVTGASSSAASSLASPRSPAPSADSASRVMAGSISCRVEQLSSAEPAVIYDVLMDIERWPEWMPTVTTVSWERLGAPDTGIGGVRRVRSGITVAHDRVVDGSRPHHHVYTASLPRFWPLKDFRGEVRLEDHPEGCLIIWTVTCTARYSALRKSAQSTVDSTYKRIAAALAREAERAES